MKGNDSKYKKPAYVAKWGLKEVCKLMMIVQLTNPLLIVIFPQE